MTSRTITHEPDRTIRKIKEHIDDALSHAAHSKELSEEQKHHITSHLLDALKWLTRTS